VNGRHQGAHQRREDEVRRMLDLPRPSVPAGLAQRAIVLGARMQRRRRASRTLLWTVLLTALAVFLLWVWITDPWSPPPSMVTPPLQGS
jgi:ferric-dicitrate binding protein FerR (iron transport regulator)